MHKMGIHTAYGTDFPMEDFNPFRNIYVAVTRRGFINAKIGSFYPDEKVDRETAVDAYTKESAYAEGLEDRTHKKGLLRRSRASFK